MLSACPLDRVQNEVSISHPLKPSVRRHTKQTMTTKKITVDGVGGVKLSSENGYNSWLQRQGVVALIDADNCQTDFKSLDDGGTYTLGPPIQQQQANGKKCFILFGYFAHC